LANFFTFVWSFVNALFFTMLVRLLLKMFMGAAQGVLGKEAEACLNENSAKFEEEMKMFQDRDELIKEISQWKERFNESQTRLKEQEACNEALEDANARMREDIKIIKEEEYEQKIRGLEKKIKK